MSGLSILRRRQPKRAQAPALPASHPYSAPIAAAAGSRLLGAGSGATGELPVVRVPSPKILPRPSFTPAEDYPAGAIPQASRVTASQGALVEEPPAGDPRRALWLAAKGLRKFSWEALDEARQEGRTYASARAETPPSLALDTSVPLQGAHHPAHGRSRGAALLEDRESLVWFRALAREVGWRAVLPAPALNVLQDWGTGRRYDQAMAAISHSYEVGRSMVWLPDPGGMVEADRSREELLRAEWRTA